MENLARAPLTINPAVSYTMNNLRPYNQPVASAITLVGLIYMLIFAVITSEVLHCRLVARVGRDATISSEPVLDAGGRTNRQQTAR
jgi:hypothetical protein